MLPRLAQRLIFALVCIMPVAAASQPASHWVTVWAASVQGPYPAGNASAQPNLTSVFPDPASGARKQSFRLILRPDIWNRTLRIRLSNVYGTAPVTFDGVFAGIQLSGAALLAGTNTPVHFHNSTSVTIPAGESAWSDPLTLPPALTAAQLTGRKLAVSFHIAGASGPMTWHAKALTTSYLSGPPGSGSRTKSADPTEAPFPATTTSWYFLDAVDMMLPATTRTA